MAGRLRGGLVAAGLTAIPVAGVIVSTPLSIYFGNRDEFTAALPAIIGLYLPYGLALCLLGGIIGAVATTAGYRRLCSILGGVAILVWLQGNILVWDYGVLDGRSISWTEDAWRGVLDSAVWCGVFLVSLTASGRVGRVLVSGAVVTLVVQALAFVPLFISGEGARLGASDVEQNIAARDAMARFSTEANVVQIVMDGFQTDIFEDLLADDATAHYRDQLDGFMLFRDNLGAYPYTQLTVPALLSGKLYRNEEPVDEFIDSTMAGETILNSAAAAGYEVDIGAPVALKNVYAKNRHANAFGIPRGSHVTAEDYVLLDAARLIDLSLFRVVPHFAKALVHRDELWIFQGRVRSQDYLHMQYFSDLAFANRVAAELVADRRAPVYKLFHLMFSHRPTVGNEDCQYDHTRATTRENVKLQAGCGLAAVMAILDGMKAAGLYEESLIVLMADHGAWVRVEGLEQDPAGAVDAKSLAMAIPLLAIKRPGATGGLSVSNAPTAITDLPRTIADELGLDGGFPGRSVFALAEDEQRERVHLSYIYGRNEKFDGYLLPMLERRVRGSVYDAASWSEIGRHDPAAR